ncbi:hypothetical protein NMY22_g15386 [Coprinellus aureogranulatus]|nr:hypothetical protein NMY22_g15386 [Coprinellus aureogranulatus]
MPVHQRRQQLLGEARTLLFKEGLVSVGKYYDGKLDMDVLRDIFDDLEAWPSGTLPPEALLPFDVTQGERKACDAIEHISLIFGGLHTVLTSEDPPNLQPLMDKCLEVLYERWEDIRKWMMHCARRMSHARSVAHVHWENVMMYCTATIGFIAFDPEKNRFKQEIAAMSSTIDVVLRFLRVVDPRTGRPLALAPNSNIRNCYEAHGRDLRLGAQRLHAGQANGPEGQLRAQGNNLSVRRPFRRLHPSVVDAAIRLLVWLATWPSLAPHAIEGLFGKGIIPVILLTLGMENFVFLQLQQVEGCSYRLLPFLTDSRTYFAAKDGGSNTVAFLDKNSRSDMHPDLQRVYDEYILAFRCCREAFEDRKHPVQICHNLKHQPPQDDSAYDAAIDIKTCSGCRVAYYCSKACQEEDWTNFHSKECSQLSKTDQARPSARIEREKLTLLEVLANRFLPSLPNIIANQPTDTDGYSKVHVFDLAGPLFRTTDKHKFAQYKSMTLGTYFKTYETVVKDNVKGRIRQCAVDVKTNPKGTTLVAGTFVTQRAIVSICAKMHYDAARAVGERSGLGLVAAAVDDSDFSTVDSDADTYDAVPMHT